MRSTTNRFIASSYLPAGPEFHAHILQQQMEGDAPGTPAPGHGDTPGTPEGGDKAPEFLTKEEFGRTAAMIRGLNESLQNMQKGMLTPDSLAQFGLIEKGEDGNYRPKAAAPKDDKNVKPREDDPVIQRVKALEAQLAEERRLKEETQRQIEDTNITNALITALSEAGAVNAKRDYVHLKPEVFKGDKGYLAKGRDKWGAEEDIPLLKHAEDFLKKNPELAKAANTGGSGTPTGPQPKGVPAGSKVISRAQWSDMTFYVANRGKFESGEYIRGQQ